MLKKRLKSYYKRQKLAAANLRNGVKGTSFDYLVIIDFEATCVENSDPDTFVHEIIEFPGVLVDVKQKTIVSKIFHCIFYNRRQHKIKSSFVEPEQTFKQCINTLAQI